MTDPSQYGTYWGNLASHFKTNTNVLFDTDNEFHDESQTLVVQINQAIIFAPPFDPPPIDQPSYPNYTLPSANLSLPEPPSTPVDYSLVFATTSSSLLTTASRDAAASVTQIRHGAENIDEGPVSAQAAPWADV